MEEINDRIKKVRKSKGLNITEFAKELRVSRTLISQIEGGSVSITKHNIMVVCNVFGVNESWLLTGDGDMFVKKPEQVLPPTDPPPALSLVDSDGKPLKPDEAELIGIYQQLDPNNKVVVVKQAKVILEVQDAAKAKGQTG